MQKAARDLNRLVQMELSKPEYDPLKKQLRELTKEYDEFRDKRKNVHDQLKARMVHTFVKYMPIFRVYSRFFILDRY